MCCPLLHPLCLYTCNNTVLFKRMCMVCIITWELFMYKTVPNLKEFIQFHLPKFCLVIISPSHYFAHIYVVSRLPIGLEGDMCSLCHRHSLCLSQWLIVKQLACCYLAHWCIILYNFQLQNSFGKCLSGQIVLCVFWILWHKSEYSQG